MHLFDGTLRGRTTLSADGQMVGETVAIFLDYEARRVESIKVKLRPEVADQLGANRSVFHTGVLEIPVRMIQSVGRSVILSVPIKALRDMQVGEAEHNSAEHNSAELWPETRYRDLYAENHSYQMDLAKE